jgi:hypothetical protein
MAHHADGRRFIEQAGYSSTRTIDDYNAGARNASVLFFAKTVT